MLHKNFFVSLDGDLCRMTDNAVVREKYSFTHKEIGSGRELRATLRAGKYAWPGGYPLYFDTSDGGALHFECVRDNLYSVTHSIRHRIDDGWRVIGCDINYEYADLICDHCNKRIESAYGDDE